MLRRRDFLAATALAPLAASAAPFAAPPPSAFSFLHFTDPHLQPELRGDAGTRAAFEQMAAIPHDFALAGGDLVMDVYSQGPERAKRLFDLYQDAARTLPKKVYSVLGNHDIYGIATKSGVASTDPLYAKRLFEDRLGQPRFQSFDHQGWHFVLLDSVQTDAARNWFGEIDSVQLAWLAADLAKLPADTPIVALTHMPLASGALTFLGSTLEGARTLIVTNGHAVLDLFRGHNLKAVLQGHTHVRELVEFDGCQYATPGAICGNWWKGAFLGSPEGYAVYTARGAGANAELTCEFRATGWKANS
jgi:3',5'-cyclic AMP phosphodiesterase CpdA